MRPRLPDLAALAVTLVFAAACVAFVRQPTLASFADDSVSYLVMAQVFSPFQPASQAVAAAFAREAFHPPLFPLLLAFTGAAHDMARAHVVTALLLAASLPVMYLLGSRWLECRWGAVLAVLGAALLPAMWVNAKGIISEPLFCVLFLAALLAMGAGEGRRARTAALALLLAALALTRTAGLILVLVYLAWAAAAGGPSPAARLRAAVPALVACIAVGAWVALRPAAAGDDNVRLLLDRLHALHGADQPWAAFGAILWGQVSAIAEAWVGTLVLFWIEGQPARQALSGLVGVLAIGGLALRLRAGEPDGWMMAGYLALYLAWPFNEQMGRFLFPVLPVLLLYAFLGAGAAISAFGRRPALAHAVLAMLLLSLTLPAMAFVQQRAAAPGRFGEITDWYRTPDLAAARTRAQTHLDLLADMDRVRELTRPQDRIMWVVPSYIALLADRQGVRAPAPWLSADDYRGAVRASGADYVFLSLYHPRDTIHDDAWRAGARALAGHAEVVHVRPRAGGAEPGSMLLKVAK